MNNYYFTYLIKQYGEEKISNLISSALNNANISGQILCYNLQDWNFCYFFSVYFCILLKYCGLNIKQIELCLDTMMAPGWSKVFSPNEIFQIQKNLMPEIEEIIKKEFNEYHN